MSTVASCRCSTPPKQREWLTPPRRTPRTRPGARQGYGMLLMEEAERIAAREHRSAKLAVISGVGTRHYYRKLGYHLEGHYMVKHLAPPPSRRRRRGAGGGPSAAARGGDAGAA